MQVCDRVLGCNACGRYLGGGEGVPGTCGIELITRSPKTLQLGQHSPKLPPGYCRRGELCSSAAFLQPFSSKAGTMVFGNSRTPEDPADDKAQPPRHTRGRRNPHSSSTKTRIQLTHYSHLHSLILP